MVINPKLNELNFTNACIALDLETTGLYPWIDKIELIAITDELGFSYVIQPKEYKKEELNEFIASLQGCYKIINHNLKFDLGFLYYHHKILFRNVHCTMVSQQILENGKQGILGFDLVSVLKRSINVDHANALNKGLMQKSFSREEIRDAIDLIPTFKLKQFNYAIEDTRHLITLYRKQIDQLTLAHLNKIYALEMKLMPILTKMEVEGCKIDKKLWKHQISTYWEQEQKDIIKKLDKEALRILNGIDFKYYFNRIDRSYTTFDLFGNSTTEVLEDETLFNYASQPHIIALFHGLGETPPVNPDGNPCVDEGALQVYLTEHGDTKLSTFLEILLEYRQITKLLSTYGDKFLAKLDKDDYIHTQYTQATTETGRLSSKNPNLQNIPKPEKKYPNKDIRKCFIPATGHKFITCDMNSAEIRIAADYSLEPLLVDSLQKGTDMHSKLSSVSYSIIFDKDIKIDNTEDEIEIDGNRYVLSELRTRHKNVVFAKFYKGGPKRVYGVLSKYINKHHKSKKQRQRIAYLISDGIDKALPKLSAYLTSLIEKAKKDGYLIGSSLGRIRYFNKETVYGDAANYPLQNTNAEALKIALINIDKYLTEIGYGRLVMNVHDEVVVEVPSHLAEDLAPKIQKIVADSLAWFLQVIEGKASVSISDYWKK